MISQQKKISEKKTHKGQMNLKIDCIQFQLPIHIEMKK